MSNAKPTFNKEKLQIIQVNLGRSFKANQNLSNLQQEKNYHISLVQEPYHLKGKIIPFPIKNRIIAHNENPKASIIIHSNLINIFPLQIEEEFVAVVVKFKNKELLIINCYAPPKGNIESLLFKIDNVIQKLKIKNVIIAGDFNAKSHTWGGDILDDRGEAVTEFIIKNNLTLLNDSNSEPTFETARGKSWIDLSIISNSLIKETISWKILKDPSYSDHKLIKMEIFESVKGCMFKTTKTGKQKALTELLNINWERESQFLNSPEDIEKLIEEFYKTLQELYKKYEKRITKEKRQEKSWWSMELEMQRKKVRAMKRRFKKSRGDIREIFKEQYYKEHKIYVENIAISKKKDWDDFLSKVTKNPFNIGYKIARNQIKQPVIIKSLVKDDQTTTYSLDETVDYILSKLYAISTETQIDRSNFGVMEIRSNSEDDLEFTQQEVESVIKNLKKDVAPGPDNLTMEFIQTVYQKTKSFFVNIFNSCLQLGYFPTKWKISKIILIPKKKNQTTPSDFRPIAINSIFGKILEKLLKDRLYYFLNMKGLFLRNQYGFKHGTSTTQALENIKKKLDQALLDKEAALIISMDIKNAFNTIDKKEIIKFLEDNSCPRNLIKLTNAVMTNRRILYKNEDFEKIYSLTKGSPQGSPLSPLLWNIMMSEILTKKYPEKVYVQAFADDLTIIVKGNSKRTLQEKANKTLNIIYNWGNAKNIEFNAMKTEFMILKGKYSKSPPVLKLGKEKIKMVQEMKILGVIIDEKLSFIPHLEYIKQKVIDLTINLNKFTGNNRGIKNKQLREIYIRGTERIITYAAPVWYKNIVTIGKRLKSIQRKPLLSITKAYKTVSNNALNVLANLPPVHLRIEKEIEMHNIINHEKEFLWKDKVFNSNNITNRIDKWQVHPAKKLRFTFNKEVSEGTEYNIFTDGSYNEAGGGSAFVVIKSQKIIETKQYSLPNYSNNFEAEAMAITKALEYITSQHNTNTYQILTDSLSVLQGINNAESLNPYIFKIKELLHRLTITNRVILTYVKGHSGNIGNEIADELAKKAIKYGEIINLPCSKNFINKELHKKIYRKWNQLWENYKTLHKSYIHNWFHNIYQIPCEFIANYQISQILSGHGRFPHYLFRFRIRTHRTCPCNLEEVDLDHYFTICKLTEKHRLQLKKYCMNLTQNRYGLLNDSAAVAVLGEMVDTINNKV